MNNTSNVQGRKRGELFAPQAIDEWLDAPTLTAGGTAGSKEPVPDEIPADDPLCTVDMQ